MDQKTKIKLPLLLYMEMISFRRVNQAVQFLQPVEAKALKLDFDFRKFSEHKKYNIYSDSFSCLQAIKICKTDHPYIYNILKEYIEGTI
jgi:hypothetical protein